MVVDDFHLAWAGISRWPLKTYPPLVVDPDAPLPITVPTEFLQLVTGKRSDIPQRLRSVQSIKNLFRLTAKRLHPLSLRKAFRARIAVADDHKPEV